MKPLLLYLFSADFSFSEPSVRLREWGGETWKAARYFLLFLTKRTERNMQIAYYWPKSSAFLIFCSSWKFFGYWCWFSQTIVVIFCKYLFQLLSAKRMQGSVSLWIFCGDIPVFSNFSNFFKKKKKYIKSILFNFSLTKI